MKSILRELMIAETPLTGAYLANVNQITVRTMRDDIKHLDKILNEHGAEVSSVMGKGYELDIQDDQKFRQFLKSISHDDSGADVTPKSPEERILYLIKRLLLSEDYLKLDDLADEMYISKPTIQNDMKQVKTILDKYDIRIESRPNYGLKVTGNELKLRFCMAEHIFNRNDQWGDAQLASISQKTLDAILAIIMKRIKSHQISLSDIALNNLLIHIAIAYKRIVSGHHVTLYKADMQEVSEQREYEVAKEIVQEVEEVFNVDFPEQEVIYIAIHLLGTKMVSQSNELVDHVLDEKVSNLVTSALEKIEKELHLGVKKDKELIFGLTLHLKPAINRYKYGMNIRNPMLEDIKKNYPLAFEAAILAGLVIEKETETKIDENEIGYLALHIGAAIERRKLKAAPNRCLIVCASGLGTAQLIYYKLKSQFGRNLEVVGTTEYYKLNQYDLHDIDFIVSSIPIHETLPVPVVEVNAIVGESDLGKIEKIIIDHQEDVYDFLRKDLMFLRKRFKSKEEALEFLYDELLQRRLVDEAFLDAVYEREAVAPTSFGNLVAIPHPIKPQSNQTFLTICTLEKPIMWKDKPVQFIGLLSVAKNSEEDLQAMYDLLGKIIENSTIVQHLIKAKTHEDFMKLLIQ